MLIASEWIGTDHRYFKVVGDDDAVYIVRQDTVSCDWELTFYQQAKRDQDK